MTVALESALLTHGLPRPGNVSAALDLEEIIRSEGARPQTVGMIAGRPVCGLTEEHIRHLGTREDVRKLSLRDLPVAAANKQFGGTTVAATLHIAAMHGVRVFVTGGIGGVHRAAPGDTIHDVSADLPALARYPVCTVCAGAKAILDLPATLEMIETLGITVVGFRTDEFPAFYSRSSGLPVDARVDSAEEAARIVIERERLGLRGGGLVVVPIPVEAEIPREEIEPVIIAAVDEALAAGLSSAEVTPFLLNRVAELTGGRSLSANLALLQNNARVGARIAVALERLSAPKPVIT